MTALQQLGEALAGFSDKQLAAIPIDDQRLLEAIRELRGIQSNSARRRHLQYIGKLMRDIDPEPITGAMQAMQQREQRVNAAFHQLETLREEVLAAGMDGVEKVVGRWPGADRQQLRQLILQHQREQKQGKPPAASRKLFKYLRQLQDEDESA
jgi:ribosome-associated protein